MPTYLHPFFFIVVLVITLIVFLLLVFMVSIFTPKQKESTTQSKPKQKTKPKERHEEVIDSLDWMMMHQIITPTEYNQLITKSLPYLNG